MMYLVPAGIALLIVVVLFVLREARKELRRRQGRATRRASQREEESQQGGVHTSVLEPSTVDAPSEPTGPSVAGDLMSILRGTGGKPTERVRKLKYTSVLPRGYPYVDLDRSKLERLTQLGNGGEAVVYRASPRKAWKVFRTPDDQFYEGNEAGQKQARKTAAERLKDYPKKFAEFTSWLGSRLVGPLKMLRTDTHEIGGYEMAFIADSTPLSKYRISRWKRKHRVTIEDIAAIYLDLYDTLREVHAAGIIIGDFKPANVLVKDGKAYIVDAESAQWGGFHCHTFTEGYVDPQICNPRMEYEVKVMPYTTSSDWYAFTVMLFESLTNIGPYQGTYNPPRGKKPVKPSARALRRISVFNKRVTLPPFVKGIAKLPKELQAFFRDVFEHGLREIPPRNLIAALAGKSEEETFDPMQHTCWEDQKIDESTATEGSLKLSLSEVSIDSGELVDATCIDGQAAYLVHSGSELLRENGEDVMGSLPGEFNYFRFNAGSLLMGVDHENSPQAVTDGPFYVVPEEGQSLKVTQVDCSPTGEPNIGLSGKDAVWIHHGEVRRSSRSVELVTLEGNLSLFTSEALTLILSTQQSQFAGLYLVQKKHVSELVGLPPIMGEVLKARCVFSENVAWLFLDVVWNEALTRYVLVINKDGHLMGLGVGGDWCDSDHMVAYDTEAKTKSKKDTHRHHLVVAVGNDLLRFTCNKRSIQAKKLHRNAITSELLGMIASGSTLLLLYPGSNEPTPEGPTQSDQEEQGSDSEDSDASSSETGSDVESEGNVELSTPTSLHFHDTKGAGTLPAPTSETPRENL